MAKILVSGLINIETTLRVEAFPLAYFPVTYPFFGVRSTISGVGYNLAKALTTLGHDVKFASIIGDDLHTPVIRAEMAALNIRQDYIQTLLTETAQSVIIYDPSGKRQIHTDLKDLQKQAYPADAFLAAMQDCDLCALCNINYNRPFLEIAKNAGKTIATDVHAIQQIDDDYNQDYMAAADILFQSHENLSMPPEDWIRSLWQRYNTPIAVIGLGAEGAMLGIRSEGFIGRFPALQLRPIVNTIGAGDALFSAFLHSYQETGSPYLAIQKAIVFASYKIGTTGAAEGFLNAAELETNYSKNQNSLYNR